MIEVIKIIAIIVISMITMVSVINATTNNMITKVGSDSRDVIINKKRKRLLGKYS